MKPIRRRRSLWPFVALLIALFILSLTAPQLWLRNGDVPVRNAHIPPVAPVNDIVLPDIQPRVGEMSRTPVIPVAFGNSRRLETPISATIGPAIPTFEEPLPLIGTQWQPAVVPEVAMLPHIEPTPLETLPLKSPNLSEVERSKELSPEQTQAADPLAGRIPTTLIAQLKQLSECVECHEWAESILARLQLLVSCPTSGEEKTDQILGELKKLGEDGTRLAQETKDREVVLHVVRLQYALTRRLDVWDKVYRGALPSTAEAFARASDHQRLSASLAHLDNVPLPTEQGPSLREYLFLDAIRNALRNETTDTDPREPRAVALRTLTRLERLNLPTKRWTTNDHLALTTLSEELRDWALETVTADQVLVQIERFEQTRDAQNSRELALLARRLTFSPDPAQQAVGKQIENHYRNSNLRIAISDSLLNRYVSEPRTQTAPVQDTILGVPVSGCSTTTNQLSIRLLPDNGYLRLCVETRGVVNSQTVSSSGPATFHNEGESHFTAQKMIRIGTNGLRVSHATADANMNSALQDIETEYDTFPLVGSIVRNVAKSQFDRKQPEAHAEAEDKVRAKVKTQLDAETDTRLAEAENDLQTRVWMRLQKLELDPSISSMTTTEQRVILRIRLAGDEQLAAYTPRPQAPADSWASLQIHQSAINNALRNLKLEGRTFTPPELCIYLSERLALPKLAAKKDELSADVKITFADHDAIAVDCRDGRLTLTVSIAELSSEKNQFRDFAAHIRYKADPNDLKAGLSRDGVIELLGDHLNVRTQVALRGVLAKLFPKERPLPLLPDAWLNDPRVKDLNITQFTADDGWIGLAIGPATRTATLVKPTNLR